TCASMITITRSALSAHPSSGPSLPLKPGGFSSPTTEGRLRHSCPHSGLPSACTSSRRLSHKPHWIRHTILTWVERNFGYAVARVYAGHTDGGSETGATAIYVRASLSEVAAALAALTGEPHPL